jgi:PPK2 family polyphosphate:nucleotide phosphotransferase
MPKDDAIELSELSALARTFTVTKGENFKLSDIDPKDTGPLKDKAQAERLLQLQRDRLGELQEKLYAQNQWAVLLIFQAMDAAGKDGTIAHVMHGIDPHGCEVHSFKAPTAEELDHDYLWRCMKRLPERGRIGIFNRSYYEEALIVRVHPEILRGEHLPEKCFTPNIWEERFTDMRNFEHYLTNNGVVVRKFFLHVSKGEQRKRFLKRLDEPEKNWKFSASDVAERKHWDAYQSAYEQVVINTATKRAPWCVVPADHKWFTRLMVAAAVIDTLESLDLSFPKVNPKRREEIKAAAESLRNEA